MYNEGSNFFVVDRNYDVAQIICGITQLGRIVQPYVKSNIVGESFKLLENSWIGDLYIVRNVKVDYIIYDENDVIVPTKLIMGIKVPRYWDNPRYSRDNKYSNRYRYKYRCDPVPDTGYKYKRRSGVTRQIGFMNEIRATLGNEEYIRPKRRHGIGSEFICSWWEEYSRSDSLNKYSWKKNKKKKQWM